MFASRTDWSLVPNRLSQAADERRRAGRAILDLTESNPTRCGFSYDTAEILAALSDVRALTYEPQAKGLLPAREAVAGYYAERGVRVDPEQIILTTSTSEAYSYVFRLVSNPGDIILAPRPSYPLFDFLAEINDINLAPYWLAYDPAWRMDTGSIEAAIASAAPSAPARAILVVHPNNPTGSLVRAEERQFLVDACRRHDLALVADEVFADYGFSPAPDVGSHVAVTEALTFTLSGLSKISALPQMKLAWIVVSGPDELVKNALARLEIIADTYLSVSAPLAHALPRLLETRRLIQPQIEQRVRDNIARLDRELASIPGIARLKSEGGWYAILQMGASDARARSDDDFTVELVQRDGVLAHPGHFYDFAEERYVVLSLLPQPEIFAEGVSKLVARLASRAGSSVSPAGGGTTDV